MNKKTTWIVVGVAVVLIVIIAAVWWNAKPAKAPEVSSMASSTPAVSTSTPSSTGGAVASSTPTSTVKVTMGNSYANADYSFTYPKGWKISSYRPFVLSTFGGTYTAAGAIPPGGAEIDVATTTVYGNLQSIMQVELSSAKNLATAAVTVNGTSCAKANYDTTVGGVAVKDTAVYCEKGSELWKLYFSYRADDAAGNSHAADFASLLASMKLL